MAKTASTSPRPVPCNRRLRSLLATLGCSVVAAIAAAPASAAGLPSSSPCADEFSQPFTAWGDSNFYKLVSGGDFESGTEGWDLSDGASLISATTQFGGESVLSLDPGASALTPPICIDGSEDWSRMLTRSDGRISAVLVEVVTERGHELLVGIVRGDSEWDASRRFLVPPFALRGDQTTFQYRFTAIGFRGTELDSVYVDPRAKH